MTLNSEKKTGRWSLFVEIASIAIAAIAFALVFTKFRQELRTSHNLWLAFVFGIFVVAILLFAIIYYGLYVRNRRNFFFNADIRRMQGQIFRGQADELLPKIEEKIEILTEAQNFVQEEPPEYPRSKQIQLDSGKKLECWRSAEISDAERQMVGPMVSSSGEYHWRFYGDDGLDLGYESALSPSLETALERLATELVRKRDRLKDRWRTLDADYPEADYPDIWSFWDFLYFSTVTQTTVGYGDILPNSTAVRIWVVVQIVVTYGLIAVVVNLTFGS